MIKIKKVFAPGKYKYHRYFEFPVVDFKFQNKGDATAVLWEFFIDIKKVVIDRTPSISAYQDVYDKDLVVKATNNGYGGVKSGTWRLENSVLDKYFSSTTLSSQTDIQSDESKEVIRIRSSDIIGSKPTTRIYLDEIKIHWDGRDELDNPISGTESLRSDWEFRLYLDSNGFGVESDQVLHSLMMPSQIYCVMLDTDSDCRKRVFPISRQISPGDVDRFHILVGANKSSSINLIFGFKVDKDVIFSKEFFIDIWNPINSGYNYLYLDGSVLDRKDKSEEMDAYFDSYMRRFLDQSSLPKNFPFLDEDAESKGDWFSDFGTRFS